MLWLKALHIFFAVCWFAGMFYLPRLFVHHCLSEHEETKQRLTIMERKLFRFITPLAVIAIALGIAMLAINLSYLQSGGWLHAKLFLIFLLCIFHLMCWRYMRSFASGKQPRSERFFRYFNEVPALLLLGITILASVRPF